MLTSRVTSVSLALALVACGKSKDQTKTTESKVAETGAAGAAGGTTAAKPGTPPAKAPSRGPERSVYSLVDNRLSAHLTRGGGLLVPGGSAGFAKYMRFGDQMSSM